MEYVCGKMEYSSCRDRNSQEISMQSRGLDQRQATAVIDGTGWHQTMKEHHRNGT